jgi:hypothetical protein
MFSSLGSATTGRTTNMKPGKPLKQNSSIMLEALKDKSRLSNQFGDYNSHTHTNHVWIQPKSDRMDCVCGKFAKKKMF